MAKRLPISMIMVGLACTATPDPVARPEPASASASSTSEPVEDCPPAPERAGFESCLAVELTGSAPCEAICRQARQAAQDPCCEDPVDVVIFTDTRELLRKAACSFVPPDCAHQHGHGNMDANLRVLDGPPVEVIIVEGGCEDRAMMHGYVPAGVAAWSGCNHQRYRWNGDRLVEQ